jgi:hypothetical protein
MASREREGEMAKVKSGRRGSAVIALIAVLAALAGPSAALADSGSEYGFSDSYSFDVVASWVEEWSDAGRGAARPADPQAPRLLTR